MNDRSLRKQYDDEKSENQKMRAELQERQSKYMDMAEQRLVSQRALFQILNLVQKSDWRKEKDAKVAEAVIDAMFDLSDACEKRAREMMDKMEMSTKQDLLTNKREEEEAMMDMSASSQVEDNLNKFVRQNKQFKRDLKNRELYLEGETKINRDFVQTTEKVVELIKAKVDDKALVDEVIKASKTASL